MSAELVQVLDNVQGTVAPETKLELSEDISMYHIGKFLNSVLQNEGRKMSAKVRCFELGSPYVEVYVVDQNPSGIFRRRKKRRLCSIDSRVLALWKFGISMDDWRFEDYDAVKELAERISAYFGVPVALKADKWALKRWGEKKNNETVSNKDLMDALAELEDAVPQVNLNLS